MGSQIRELSGAAIFVEAIKSFGVEYIFSVPGTTILDIYDVIRDRSDIKLIVTRHEQVAAMMADGYARISGKPAVVLVSRSPATCNTAIGLHGAYVESFPMLMVNGAPANTIAYRDCFEEMDFAAFTTPISKWYVKVDSASRVAELTFRALKETVTGRPRPVAMSLPIDVQKAKAPFSGITQKMGEHSLPAASKEGVEQALKVLLNSKRCVVMIGGGGVRSGASEAIQEIAEMLDSPVVSTWNRADAFPNSHPMYAGSAGPGSFEATKRVLKEADTVLAIGCRFSEFTTARWTIFSDDIKLIHVDIDPYELGKIYSPKVSIVSDAKSFAKSLASQLKERMTPHSGDLCAQSRKEWSSSLLEDYKSEKEIPQEILEGSSRAKLVHALKESLDEDAVIVIDCATFGPWMTRYFGFEKPGTMIGSAAGCLGFGFPGAMGAKIAAPHKAVVAVVGDGSFLMCIQDLATAVKESINVVVVVVNNFCYGNIAERQEAYYGGRLTGCFLNNPDFAEVAKLFGAHGEKVENPDEYMGALDRALKSGKPSVINVIEPPGAGMPPGAKPLIAK